MCCIITIRVICIDCIKDAHSFQVWKVKPFCTAFNGHQGHIKNNAGFRHFAITDYKRFKVLTLVLSVSKQDFHSNQWVMSHQSFIVSVVTDWTHLKCVWTFAVPMCQCNNMSGSCASCFGSWLALSQQGWETLPIFIVSTIVIPHYHTKKKKNTCVLFLCSSQKRLVVKPDQLIKRRGKLGLVGINKDLQGVREWLKDHLMKETTVS